MRYQCGNLEIDPGAYRLTRQGVAVRLEPRVFELLVYLVENRDRVVSKDELIEKVWSGHPVSESVLSRSVHKARRAVGDESGRQELIKTIHRRGYQWVAPVIPSDEPDAEPGKQAAIPPDKSDLTAGGTQDSGLFASKRRRLALAAVLPMLVLGGILIVAMLRTTEPRAADGIADEPVGKVLRIGMMPITSASDRADVRLAALSISDLLALRLERHPAIVLRSRAYMDELESKTTDLAELAQLAQVDYLVSGTARMQQGVPRVLISMELHHDSAKAPLGSIPLGSYEVPLLGSDSDLAAWVQLREAMASDILEHVAPAIGLEQESGSPPTKAEAYRLYLEAREHLSQLSCGQGDAAMVLLDRSLQLDPGFALAWVAKGVAYWSRTWACGRGVQYLRQALVPIERALALDPALPEAVLFKALILVELGEVEKAYAYILKARELVPQTPSVFYATAYALRYAGYLEAAEEQMHAALRLDPLFFHEVGEAPLSTLYLRHYEDFFSILPGPSRPYHLFYRGFGELHRGQPQHALEVLQAGYAMDPNGYYGRASACLTALLEGDRELASDLAGAIANQRIKLGSPDGEASYRVAQLLALTGDQRQALVMLERAVEQGFFCVACYAGDPFLAPLRDDPRFIAAMESARQRHLRFGERFGLREPQ